MPPKDMGVATSSVTFFRSMGGTFGAAVSLAVLFGSLAGNIQSRAREAGLPAEVIDRFSRASALDDTSVIATLPPRSGRPSSRASPTPCRPSSWWWRCLLVPAFVLSLLVKEIPLRSEGGLAAARADEDGAAARAKREAESAVVL
jgi:hypothetical protein